MLDTTLVDIPFRSGVDTKTNAKLVLPGKLLILENGVFTEAATIKKRNGYTALAKDILAATVLASADALASFDNELLLAGAGSLYSWSPNLSKWANRGSVSNVTAKSRSIVRNTYNQSNPDSASVNGITLHAWVDGRGGVYGMVVDESTGAVLLAEQQLDAAGVRPRCIAIQTALILVYQSGSNIVTRVVSSGSPTAFGAAVNIFADGHATPANQHLDVCPSSYGSGAGTGVGACFLTYNTSSASTIKICYLRADGAVGQTSNGYPNAITVASTGADKSIAAVLRSTGDIYVLYSNATNLSVTARFPDLTQKLAPAVVEALANVENVTGLFDSGDVLRISYEVQAALDYNRFVKVAQSTPTGTVSGIAVLIRSVGLAGKYFAHSSGNFFVVVHDPSPSSTTYGLQNTYFVVKTDGTIIARLQVGTADRKQVGQIPTVRATTDANVFTVGMPCRTQFVTANNTAYSLVGLTSITLSFGAVAMRSAQLGGSLIFAGGFPGCYDGISVTENGFHLYPENVSAVAAAGGSMAAGTYGFVVVFEWTDGQGQRHRSAPSIPLSVVVGAAQKVTLTIPTLRITARGATRTKVEVVVYSTTANGIVYYKTPNDPATDPVASPLYNDTTADTVSFVRTIVDASITANQILYTQGGILPNMPPPAARLIAVTKNRAFLAGLEDVRRVWYSKSAVRTEGVSFNDGMYFDVDPAGGDLVQIAPLDEKVIFFKRNQIEMVQGDGPDDLGQGSSFINPVVITTDCGCVDAGSIAPFPNGLVFKSDKGIYALTRSLQAVYIGAPVEAFNGSHVVSTQLVEKSNEVRFLLDDSKTALVWNYFFDEWSVFTNHGGIGSAIWLSTNQYAYVSSAGQVFLEQPGTYTDNGVDIHLKMRTAWLKLSNLQGFMLVRRAGILGDFYSAHTFRVRVAYDYRPYFEGQYTWTPASVILGPTFGADAKYGDSSPFGGGVGQDQVNQFSIHLERQKCESICFEIEDVGSSPGQAYSIAGLSLEVGTIPGGARLPDVKSR